MLIDGKSKKHLNNNGLIESRISTPSILKRFSWRWAKEAISGDEAENLNFLQRCFAQEALFGHTFLWYPIALIFGSYFHLSRDVDITIAASICLLLVVGFIRLAAMKVSMSAKYLLNLAVVFSIGVVAASLEFGDDDIILDQAVTTNVSGVILDVKIDKSNIPRYRIEQLRTESPTIYRSPSTVQLVARGKHEIYKVGDFIEGRARLTPPSGPVFPGGFDFSLSAMRSGISAYGFFYGSPSKNSQDSAVDMFPLSVKLAVGANQIRTNISSRVDRALNGDAAAITKALIVSDRRAISTNVVDALRASGLAHVLAISGLHMVLAAGTFFYIVRFVLSLFPSFAQSYPTKKIAAFGAILAASSYLAISGAPVSAQRAWIMLMIILIAVLLDRPAITIRNVAIAAGLIVLMSPSSVLTPGFQMSFAAAAALVTVYTGWTNRVVPYKSQSGILAAGAKSLVQFILGLAATALIAGFATGIFSIQHFHHFAGYGVLGNVLAMPIVTLLVMPLALLSVLSMPFGLETYPLQAMGWSIELVIELARWVANLGSGVVLGKPSPIFVAVATIGFIIFIGFKSVVRWSGLALICFAAFGMFAIPLSQPDILISEDGKLIGIRNGGQLALNRARPSSFVLNQWEAAFQLEPTKPKQVATKSRAEELLGGRSETLWNSIDSDSSKQGFKCLVTNFCYYETDEIKIATVGKSEYLNHACERAEIIILSIRKRDAPPECNDVEVYDVNSLRRTGSMAFYKLENQSEGSAHKKWRIETAIKNKIKPWTINRYYDWRSRSYYLPGGQVQTYQRPDQAPLSGTSDTDE